MALAEAIARNMGFQQSGCSVSIAGCSVSTEVQMYFIAELDDLCHWYLDFCDDYLFGGGEPT